MTSNTDIRTCKDIKLDLDTKAVYFDGTAVSIKNLQKLLTGAVQLNLNTLHTKIGWWCVRYPDNSILWKRSTCFENNFKILN